MPLDNPNLNLDLFSFLLDSGASLASEEGQTEPAVRPSSPCADASYELSKPGHDLENVGPVGSRNWEGPCRRCFIQRIGCVPSSTDPLAPCIPCLRMQKEAKNNNIPVPCIRGAWWAREQSIPAINAASVDVGPSVTSIGVPHARTSSITKKIPDADSLRAGFSDPANNGDSELAPFKCSVPDCTREFRRASDRAKHERIHTKPFKCSFSACESPGFAERKALARHYQSKHLAGGRFKCLCFPCPRIFDREDNCKRHMTDDHGHQWTYDKAFASGSPAENGIEPDFPVPRSSAQCEERDKRVQTEDRLPTEIKPDIEYEDMFGLKAYVASIVPDGVGFSTDLPEYCAATDSGYASLGRVAEPQAKDVLNDAPNDAEDSATVYSVANDVSQDDMEMYTSQFAEALADIVSSATQNAGKDTTLVQAVGASLPELLRAFSLSDIASRFESTLVLDSQASVCGNPSKLREKPDLLAILGWLDGLSDEDEYHDLSHPTLDMDESCDVLLEAGEPSDQASLPNMNEYTHIVFESVAYRWLTASLKKEFLLSPVPSQRHLSGRVYSEVVRHLGNGRKSVSSKRSSDLHTLKLQVAWDPKAFLREEFGTSQESLGQLLGKTITLTGSATDAQALPCEGYLRQTWPATGPGLLALLARALDSDDEVQAILPDKTQVKLDFKPRLRIEIRGTSYSIVEVVEQIAWLGAALRTSGPEISGVGEGLSLCSPTIHISPGLHGDSPPIYTLEFQTALIPNDAESANAGQCWHRLFRDPCIAVGYPIPRRSKYDTGLEIPLTIMARLAQSPRIHHWFGKYLLKGFSTAIVPSQRLNDATLWHLYYSDGGRLPYPDMGTIQCADVDGDEMAKGRHILGWCSEAHFYAGSKDANYAIRESRLSLPGKDFSLEKVSFSVGQIVTGGCQFSIGRKDTPIRITRGGYVDKLRWIRQRYFTLYDVDENRGFLIDGASTLLHLLRTSLHLSSVDEFASEFLFEPSKFQESTDSLKRSSALKVLLSEASRRLPLYREDANTSTTVQQRIEQLYETLEKLVDHARHTEAAHKGIQAKPRISTHLKGWDFADLAADRDPFHLKVAKLPLSVPWVDFTRAIPAVTLFGRGFGELIRPAAHPRSHLQTQTQTATQACLDWMALPIGQYHLCVGVADLRTIVQRTVGSDDTLTPITSSGSNHNSPLTVAPGVVLCYNKNSNNSPRGGGGEMFRRCVCEGPTGTAATAACPVPNSKEAAHGSHAVLELVPEGGSWGGMGGLFNDTDGSGGSKIIVDLSVCPPDGAVILGMPKSKRSWPWQQQSPPPVLTLPSSPLGVGSSPPQGASLASAGSGASTTELDSEAGSGSGFGFGSGPVTPPTSVASGGSGAGDEADPVLVGGGLGLPVGSGTKRRRGWYSEEDGSEGSGLESVESGKRRKMLSRMRETTRGIRRALVKGAPGRDGDVDRDMVGDVEMEEG